MITATELLAKGELLEEKGDYTRARRMYEKALSIQERAVGIDNPELIPFIYSLGLIQLCLENDLDAQRLLSRLLDLVIAKHGELHEDAAEIRGFLNALKPDKKADHKIAVTA